MVTQLHKWAFRLPFWLFSFKSCGIALHLSFAAFWPPTLECPGEGRTDSRVYYYLCPCCPQNTHGAVHCPLNGTSSALSGLFGLPCDCVRRPARVYDVHETRHHSGENWNSLLSTIYCGCDYWNKRRDEGLARLGESSLLCSTASIGREQICCAGFHTERSAGSHLACHYTQKHHDFWNRRTHSPAPYGVETRLRWKRSLFVSQRTPPRLTRPSS